MLLAAHGVHEGGSGSGVRRDGHRPRRVPYRLPRRRAVCIVFGQGVLIFLLPLAFLLTLGHNSSSLLALLSGMSLVGAVFHLRSRLGGGSTKKDREDIEVSEGHEQSDKGHRRRHKTKTAPFALVLLATYIMQMALLAFGYYSDLPGLSSLGLRTPAPQLAIPQLQPAIPLPQQAAAAAAVAGPSGATRESGSSGAYDILSGGMGALRGLHEGLADFVKSRASATGLMGTDGGGTRGKLFAALPLPYGPGHPAFGRGVVPPRSVFRGSGGGEQKNATLDGDSPVQLSAEKWPKNEENEYVVERLIATPIILNAIKSGTNWSPNAIALAAIIKEEQEWLLTAAAAASEAAAVTSSVSLPPLQTGASAAMAAVRDGLDHTANAVLRLPAEAPILTVVIAAHQEVKYLERTLDSLINSTHPMVLHEILIVDDASFPALDTAYNASKYRPGLITYMRNEKREGLIRSKIRGGNAARGDLIVFLDAHVKPDPGWISPILRHINSNYKRVVVPKIPTLNADTWTPNRSAVGTKMMFRWDLSFHWFEDTTQWVPCMSGGLLAISKRWWTESGTLDSGMRMWGGENIEQSIRIWLCGGEVVVARDSVISHVFRSTFPYSIDSFAVEKNKQRTVEVWWDEYKDKYYESHGRKRKIQDVNIGERLELKKQLNCKPFQWYIDRFADVFFDQGLVPRESFLLRNPNGYCLLPSDFVRGGTVPVKVAFAPCDEDDNAFRWLWRANGTALESHTSGRCLDAGNVPRHVGDGTVPSVEHEVVLYSCLDQNHNHEFRLESRRITHASYCLGFPAKDVTYPSSAVEHTAAAVVVVPQNKTEALSAARQHPLLTSSGLVAHAVLSPCRAGRSGDGQMEQKAEVGLLLDNSSVSAVSLDKTQNFIPTDVRPITKEYKRK